MDPKEEYKLFCEREKYLPLFLTYDWMNLVAPSNWNVIIKKNGDDIVAVFPYTLNKRKGFRFIELPPLTAFGGIWIKYPEGQKYTNVLGYEKEIITSLINQLPGFDSFVLKLSPAITNWLPFYWKGYSQETWYTYLLQDLSDREKLFENFKDDVRRNIRKAEKKFTIEVAETSDELFELKNKTSIQTGIKAPASKEYLESILKFCKENKKGEILLARQGEQIHSAAFFVWDNTTCYNLYAASDPAFKNTDAMTVLIWHAIQKYSSHVREFNFEGSMIEGVESFFRSFGGKQVPYFVIRKTNSRLLKLKEFLKEL